MPGGSPAGNRRLSGTRAQDGKFTGRNQTPVPVKTAALRERTAGRQHGVGLEILPT